MRVTASPHVPALLSRPSQVAIAILSLAALASAEIYAPPLPIGGGLAAPGGSIIGGPSGGLGPGGIGAALFGPGSVTAGFTSGPGGISVNGLGPGSGGGLGFAPAGPGGFSPSSGIGFAPGAAFAPGASFGPGSAFAPGAAFGPGGPGSSSFNPGISAAFGTPPRFPASTYGPPGF
ncbi:spidroin-2-like [Hetaerina americana]|uniref:spidroin-2-like n=1 Tax=Hetaerina americana TaxID=62018 RepID=UPI003A7F1BEF